MEVLFIIFGIFLLLFLAVALLIIFVRKNPKRLLPFLGVIRKFPPARRYIDSAGAKALSENPEEVMSEMSRAERQAYEKVMSGRDEKEREEVIEKVLRAADSGDMQAAARAIQERPKTLDQKRAQAKKKSKARQKKKQARAQKKKSR